ncbi:MAG: GPI anchored serine-threonine rich family protein, partial [Candidatus Omnitrophica bacterium]|nr:GPI anchored serine-threonine rich family protein [Candidatus Omnitrophota bacterium]
MWSIKKRVSLGKIFFLAGLIGVLFLPVNARAVQINRVQSGTVSYANIDIVDTSTLAYAVDPTKSIILINTSADGSASSRDGNFLFTPYFEDSEHIALSRDYGACAANVSFQVVEFKDGVKVIHGFSSMDKDTKVKTVNLPQSVNSANAFVLVYTRGYITTSGDTEVLFLKADLISDTQIQLTRLRSAQEAGITRTINITYQVVEFETDAVIKKGLETIAYTQYSQTATVNPAITDINKSFLVFNFVGGAGINGVESQMLPRGTITDSSTLTFARGLNSGGTTDYVDIKWYLVELTDESSLAQKGTATVNAASLTGTATLSSATDLTRTAVFTSVDANTTSTTNSYLDDCSNRVVQTDSTTVTFTREESVVRNDIDWFAVEFAPLTLKIPNGGEVWQVGDTENITWVHAASLETGGSCVDAGYVGHHLVNLKLSMNSGGDSYPLTIISGIRGTLDTYAWTLPAEISGTDIIGESLRVQIIDTDMAARNYDVSNEDFIIKGTVTINQPPNTWKIGDINAISWTYTGNLENLSPNTVTVTLSTDGSSFLPTAIISDQSVGTGGNGSYNWTIPADWDSTNLITTTNKVKVTLNYNPSDPDTLVESSSANFTLKGQIYEVSPIIEEMWLLGETKTISWTKKGHFGSGITDGTVNIYYSYNEGLSYESIPIASDIAAGTDALGGTYDWTIPNSTYLSAPKSRLKVVSTSDATVYGESEGFTLMSSLDVNRPLGSEVWRVGQTEDVKWTIHGAMSNVVIKYKVGAGTFEYLSGAAPADLLPAGTPEVEQIFSWFIPDDIGANNVYLRVCNRANENVYDEVGPFSIKGSISVSEPHVSEIINLGDAKNIQWNVAGSVTGNVNIRLSQNGGTSYLTLIDTVPVSPNSYSWSPIAGNMGTNNKIKVALDGDENLLTGTAGESNAFSVEGDVTLTYPNSSGLVFNVGDTVYIKWTPSPTTLGTVNIRYSTDGGTSYNGFIADGVATDNNPGSGYGYLWEIDDIPGMVGTTCRVKVYQVGKESQVHSESQYNFVVKGSIHLTSPIGGETWYVDQFNSITWTKGGDLGTLKLAYSKDGGSDGYGSVIATGVACDDLSFPWQVEDAIGTQLKVKISQETDPTTNDASPANFTIKGRIVLNAPIGGETWLVGNSENISWTTYGTIGRVNIFYSTDGGGTYGATVATNLTNVDGFLWTIPDAIDTDIRIKVESFYDNTVFSESLGNFTIKGQVRVTAPNGGEKWRVDATENINWVVNGSIGNVKIEYSTNSGASYDTVIVASTPGLDQTYAWTNIPDSIGIALRIKITSLSNGTVLDESDADFEIKGVLTLTAPNGTEIWKVGDLGNITWTKKGTLGNIELRYSTDSGVTFPEGQIIVTGIASTATPNAWLIPDRIGTGLRVQVSLLSDPTNVLDASDANFEIKGNLALTSPVGAEEWEVEASKQITWNLNGSIALVKIEYSNDGGNTYPNTITNGTSAIARTYNWTIPDDIGSLLRVKISDASDAAVNDVSPANFNIKGKLVLLHPNGGETLTVGQSYTVDWTTYGTITRVNLYYSVNSGSSYDTTIIAALNNTSSYDWTVPDAIGTQLRVKVENPDNTSVADVSNGDFTIKGKLIITAPNGGETWIVDDPQNITWTKQGTISTVKLDYSINGGATYDYPIATGITAGDISYAWTVADAIGNNLMVRITNEADATVKDESNAVFNIKGSITITTPNGGEAWTIGSAQDINWTKHGTIGSISILYSTDGGTTYPLT